MTPEQRRRISAALMADQFNRPTPQDGPVTERAGIFPLGTYANGKTGLAWPGIIAQPAESFYKAVTGQIQPGTPEFAEAGFDVGGAAMMGSLLAPRPRGSLGMGGRPEQPKGITAYHGSPHDFERFDMSKIGTGEGAQAYGHGLYFAENEGVAKQYRDKLSSLIPANVKTPMPGKVVNGKYQYEPWTAEQQAALDAVKTPPGKVYEVRINADPEDFLDWDKPLSQQNERARSILEQKLADDYFAPDAPVGQILQRELLQRDAVQPFRDAGIPGIRYLDQGSRTAGDGSRNYVVFDDKLVEILRKYGLAGFGAGAAAYGMSPSQSIANKLNEPVY